MRKPGGAKTTVYVEDGSKVSSCMTVKLSELDLISLIFSHECHKTPRYRE